MKKTPKMTLKMSFFKIFEKQKNVFLSYVPRIFQSFRFVHQEVCSVARGQTDRQTDRHTYTKVKTEDTLSGFQDFFKFSFNLSSRSGPIVFS